MEDKIDRTNSDNNSLNSVIDSENLSDIEYKEYSNIWNISKSYINLEDFSKEDAWRKIDIANNKIANKKDRKKNIIIYTSIAVAACSLLALSISLFRETDIKQNKVKINSTLNNKVELSLPDNTNVILNSSSKITYDFDSKKRIRNVYFIGEAFFNVAKDKCPFIINLSDKTKIQVLGTSFNLKAYPKDSIITASLVEGSILIKHFNEEVIIKSGDVIQLNQSNGNLTKTNANIKHNCGWLKNKLYMENMSLKEVSQHMERWYNVKIMLNGNIGDTIHYNGVIQEETILDVMDALCKLSDIKYQIKGKEIFITSKSNAYGK